MSTDESVIRRLAARADTPPAGVIVVRRLLDEVWQQGNLAAIDELVAPDAVVYQSDLSTALGPDAYRDAVSLLRTAFPDLRITVEDLIATGDQVVVRWTVHGTHQGYFLALPPTGTAVTMARVSIFRVTGGKVVEEWCGGDVLGLKEQLAIVLRHSGSR